jgi:4-hydroxybenzoate polyprenyltransferase
MHLAKVFHLMTIVLWGFFVQSANLGFYAILAVVLSAIMLTYEHYLVNKDFTKIDKAFFTVNGYLGILFFLLIILEIF